jgi:hypothetical protein
VPTSPKLDDPSPRSARVRRAGIAILCLFGLAFGLAVAEVYLRFAPYPSRRAHMGEDPVLHHRLRPNFDAPVSGTRFTTNSLGLRDREYAIPKPARVFRILMLGDSFTEGGGLENDETVAKVVEAGLRSGPCGNAVEVVNAGHASYSPILQYLMLREIGLRLQPDLVVVNFDMTDVHDDYVRTRIARLDANGLPIAVVPDRRIETWLIMPPVFPRPLRWLEDRMGRLAVYQTFRKSKPGIWLVRRFTLSQAQIEAKGLIGNLRYDRLALARDADFADVREGWALTERYLAGIQDLARRHGAGFALVVYPHAYQVSATASPVGRERMGMGTGLFSSPRPFAALEELGARGGFPVVNLLALFRQREPLQGPLFRERDFHHTRAGATVFGEGVLTGLRERRLVPCDTGRGR